MLKIAEETVETFRQRLLFAKREIDVNGCWLWTGYVNDNGYGLCTIDYKRRLVHVVAYELFIGPIPEGFQLDHLCPRLFELKTKAERKFIRRCFNPAHLEPTTQQENLRRGREFITHCPRGHEYTKENTYWQKTGTQGRHCITCDHLAHSKSNGGR